MANVLDTDKQIAVIGALAEAHPKANTAYAWLHDTGDPSKPTKHVTVLHVTPVVSPLTAVRAFIVQEFRSNADA